MAGDEAAPADVPPPPKPPQNQSPFRHLVEMGPGFWNLQGSFKVAGGLVDIGNHMSFIRLGSGKILIVDFLGSFSPNEAVAAEVQREVDLLTNKGEHIEAVVFTHPFHTGGVLRFRREYPDVPAYGAPRHLTEFPEVRWSGVLTDESVRSLWEPEVSLRIPSGTEFVAPVPPASNHLSTCLAYHRPSRTLHVDDFFNCFDRIWERMGKTAWAVCKACRVKEGRLSFHPSLLSSGLKGSAENPGKLLAFMQEILCQWSEMENICTAHNGVVRGAASEKVRQLVEATEPQLRKLAGKLAKGEGLGPEETSHMWGPGFQKEVACG